MTILNDPDLIAEFVTESKEQLADIENQILAIEAAGANADAELVNSVFRAVHSIKGAAGFLGLTVLSKLAHEMENVLNLIRSGQLVLTSPTTDALLRSADQLRGLLEDVGNSNSHDVTQQIDLLQKTVAGLIKDETPASRSAVAEVPTAAQPAPPAAPPAASVPPSTATPPARTPSTANPPADTTANHAPPTTAPAAASSPPAARTKEQESAPTAAASDSSIRVPVATLDRLMNLAGELVLSRNQLLQAVNAGEAVNLGSIAGRVDQVTSEIQETVMQARMQEIGTIFSRFPRVVRDLSITLGKQCDLRLEGTHVELDKSIIEAICDPLTHLIRNAVDHGVETPERRLKTGKPAKGTIVLRAFHQAGKVNIAISDNGRGIDAAKLREKAVSRGVLTAEQAQGMSDRDALRLIFRPGFSTAEKVSDVSGRGVGMDVVRTNIEKLGGTVAVETQVGMGTTIHIRLPLTLAILPSLIVHCRDQRFAIPQTNISELVRITSDHSRARIQRIKGAEVIRLRGELLPLVRLEQALKLCDDAPTEPSGGAGSPAANVIVVETGRFRYGIVVDGLHDSEEIVVKPLGRHAQDCACLAGATILGDGHVAMILDIAGIATYSRLNLPDDDDLETGEGIAEREIAMSPMLLFSNDPAEWFAVPMDLISRVERIRAEQIEHVGGQMVIGYRGGSLPVVSLEEHIKARPRRESQRLYVAVYNVNRRELGLIVPDLVDIRRLENKIDTVTLRERAIVGSLVVDGRPVRLLDLSELTRLARPDWFQNVQEREARPVILLAEDSPFFRNQLINYLAADRFEVEAFSDGMSAWERLVAEPKRFSLVLTDVEMPRMNGLELTRRIKSDPSLSHLPVVAVTSLSAPEDVDRAKAIGVDEYLVKLERDRLLECINHLLESRDSRRCPVAAADRQPSAS